MQTSIAGLPELLPKPDLLRDGFLHWQCRIRQIMMRSRMGRPERGVMPSLTLSGSSDPMGSVITILSKGPAHSKTPEMRHMATRTRDPVQIRESALKFFSGTYYQKGSEFSDILTATFPPGSKGAQTIRRAGRCILTFDNCNQRFELDCKVWKLSAKNPLREATYWHNVLFNPSLPKDTVILGFEPDWGKSNAIPTPI